MSNVWKAELVIIWAAIVLLTGVVALALLRALRGRGRKITQAEFNERLRRKMGEKEQ